MKNKYFQNFFFLYLYVYTLWPNYISLQIGSFPGINFPKIFAVILFFIWISILIKRNATYFYFSNNYQKIKKYVWLLIAYYLLVFVLTILFHFETRKVINLFLRYCNTLLIIFVIASFDDFRFRKKLFVNLTRILLIVSIIGLVEFIVRRNLYSYIFSAQTIYASGALGLQEGSLYRIISSFSHNLNLAQFFIVIVPFTIFLGKHYLRKIKKRYWFYIYLSIGVSLLTFSRALYISYFAFFVIELIYINPKNTILNFVRIVFISMFIIILVYINFNVGILDEISIEYRGKPLTEDVHREGQLLASIPIISDNLFKGYGITQAAETLDYGTNDGTPTVDNQYLTVILESGIIALILLFTFYIIIIVKAFRINKYLVMASFGFVLQNFTLSNLESHYYFYLIAAIILLTSKKELKKISYA